MSLTSKLSNPTPYDVAIEWEPGVFIKIPADSTVSISYEQMKDFSPGQPGSEEVRKLLDSEGVFLIDGDRSWEVQALETLKKASRIKKEEFRTRTQNWRNTQMSGGTKVDDNMMEEFSRRSGLYKFQQQAELMDKRISLLEEAVGNSDGRMKKKLDPSVTCFGTDVPREFPTPLALKMFLSSASEDVVKKHNTFLKAYEKETNG